MKLNRGPKQH